MREQDSDRRTVKVGKLQNTVRLILLRFLVFPPHKGMGVALRPLRGRAGVRGNLLESKRRTGSTTLYFEFSYFDRATIRLLCVRWERKEEEGVTTGGQMAWTWTRTGVEAITHLGPNCHRRVGERNKRRRRQTPESNLRQKDKEREERVMET